jgi:hypothetical protein
MLLLLLLLLFVCSTDAEGRLTLADALWFAQEKAGATVSGGCGRPRPLTLQATGTLGSSDVHGSGLNHVTATGPVCGMEPGAASCVTHLIITSLGTALEGRDQGCIITQEVSGLGFRAKVRFPLCCCICWVTHLEGGAHARTKSRTISQEQPVVGTKSCTHGPWLSL